MGRVADCCPRRGARPGVVKAAIRLYADQSGTSGKTGWKLPTPALNQMARTDGLVEVAASDIYQLPRWAAPEGARFGKLAHEGRAAIWIFRVEANAPRTNIN